MKKSGLADSPFFTAQTTAAVQGDGRENANSERFSERTEERTVFRSEKRTAALPRKRRTTRYSFEFYEDQLLRLKQLKYRSEMAGESITLSVMARQALDDYLRDKNI